MHKFEISLLGIAPFKVVGYEEKTFQAAPGEPLRAGSTCDYCATAIRDVFCIESADGKRFKVGSSCVKKTGDAGLIRKVNQQVTKIKRDRKRTRDDTRINAGRKLLAEPTIRAKLNTQEHPHAWARDAGKSKLEWADWTMEHAGTRGRLECCTLLENLAKEADLVTLTAKIGVVK